MQPVCWFWTLAVLVLLSQKGLYLDVRIDLIQVQHTDTDIPNYCQQQTKKVPEFNLQQGLILV